VVSILIVTRKMNPAVERLARRVLEMPLARSEREVLIVAEDASVGEPAAPELLGEGLTLVRIPSGRGLGYNRNRALEASGGEIVAFLDDDCCPADDWLLELLEPLEDPAIAAVVGAVRVPPSTFLGDSIAALGFPAGGSVGFEVMFRVDENGFTDHLTIGNCAVRRRVFSDAGVFDETMVAGGEDGELSHRIRAACLPMKFQPSATVEHAARAHLGEFARWFFRRGRAAYEFSRRAPAGPVIGHRLASYRRILWMHRADPKIVVIVPLLTASVLLQEAGFAWEWAAGRAPERPTGAA
jgi:GT2 family glycosyltransferase